MSDLERRTGRRMTRKQREQRAYSLVTTGGAAAVASVVLGVLAVLDVLSGGPALVAALVAVFCFVMFRRTVGK